MKRDFRDAVFAVIHDLMRQDENVVVLTNDNGAWGLDKIREEFPQRVVNVGVAEQNMMSLAGGLASAGKRVFAYGQCAHLMRAWEQIKVGICIPNLPVTILGVGAGLSMGRDGPTHHAVEDVALMRVLANMTIYNPADWVCAEACVKMAYEARTPHYVRLDKEQLPNLYQPGHDFSRGFCGFGDDVLHRAIFSTGIETWRARQKALRCVIDIFRLKPVPDFGGYFVDRCQDEMEVWDEHNPSGGLYSIVAEALCGATRIGLPDKFQGTIAREPIDDKPLAWVDNDIPFGGE